MDTLQEIWRHLREALIEFVTPLSVVTSAFVALLFVGWLFGIPVAESHYDGTLHFHEQRQPTVGEHLFQELERDRLETLRQQDHYRDRYNNPLYNNPLRASDCLGGNFRSCQGLSPRR